MRYSFVGKNVDITENFQEKIIKKLERIAKLFPADAEAAVTLSDIKLSKKADVTVTLPNKRILKAEVIDTDLMAGLDRVVDILEGQMVKYKNRLHDKAKRSQSFADELNAIALEDDSYEEEEDSPIVKVKKIPVKPMDPEEAVMQLEMLGHSFFVFRNAQSDEVNVVYKRNDGAYALIETED
jgi:putative sigma-54 modulation protein